MSPRSRQHMMGESGECICPKCDRRIAHRDGVRCQDERCERCGAKMLRVGSEHYRLWLEKKRS
jgi:Zn finger protein HypA/HybF involved in hydrogenase expression